MSQGFVYAVADGEGRVKIGWSRNPIRRLAQIAIACPRKVELLGYVQATRDQEAEVHTLLSRWRLGGEWFALVGPVIAFVEMLPKPRPVAISTELPKKPETVPDLINAFGGATAFSRVIDKGASTASEMKRTRSIPVYYWPRVIAAAQAHGIEGVSADFLMAIHAGAAA